MEGRSEYSPSSAEEGFREEATSLSGSELFCADAFCGLAFDKVSEVLASQCVWALSCIETGRHSELHTVLANLDRDSWLTARWMQLRRLLVIHLERVHWTLLLDADPGSRVCFEMYCFLAQDYDARRALFGDPSVVDVFLTLWVPLQPTPIYLLKGGLLVLLTFCFVPL